MEQSALEFLSNLFTKLQIFFVRPDVQTQLLIIAAILGLVWLASKAINFLLNRLVPAQASGDAPSEDATSPTGEASPVGEAPSEDGVSPVCEAPSEDFQKIVNSRPAMGSLHTSLLAEWYFTRATENLFQSPIAQAWSDIIGDPVIPYDPENRREVLAHAYQALAAYIEAHQLERDQQSVK